MTDNNSNLLCDIEILQRLVADDESCIFVSPLINPRIQIGPSSLDLHLGTDLFSTKRLDIASIDLTAPREQLRRSLQQYLEPRRVMPGKTFVIHPRELILASALEFIRLPTDIAARLEGRSSLGRLGIQVHATAGFVDPEFRGMLTFELINAGSLPVTLRPGIRIAQICFFKISPAQIGYSSKSEKKYADQLGVKHSMIHMDSEVGE